MELGARIAAWRRDRKLSQRALAKAIGVSPAAVGLWETNGANPRTSNVEAVAKALGLSMEEFYGATPSVAA